MPLLTRTTQYTCKTDIATPVAVVAPVSFLQTMEILNNVATETFVNQNLGAASAGRVIYCVLHTRGIIGETLSSATIGGVAATIHAQAYAAFVGGDNGVAIFSAAVPTGTTGDVVTTHSGLISRRLIALYRVNSQTAVDDSDSVAFGPAGATGTLTLTTVPGGSLIGTVCQSG